MTALTLLSIPLSGLLLAFAHGHQKFLATYLNYSYVKSISLNASVFTLTGFFVMFALFDLSNKQFQFVEQYYDIGYFDLCLGVDGLSLYFVLLTSIIMPVSLLSNWVSISNNLKSFLVTVLLLEIVLLIVFLVLDAFLFYVFFESILPPLFFLIGWYGSSDRMRASFYLFLYTLLGSLFLLLSILSMLSTMGSTDLDLLFKSNFGYYIQIVLFAGVFIAFAVKTPTIFLNIWLLKAHVESPLSGSIILAGIVLKLSLFGILRLILPILPKAYLMSTYLVYLIGVITIMYAGISTLRTIDIKELIAYSSVSHAAVYLMGVLSNTIQGIEGAIILGLAHGFVSSGLFICAGGVLYDRSGTRLITYYRGIAQLMPVFSVLFFILCLANCGVPLTLNFIGEFMSLYGAFERLPLLGALASSSIVFSAAYTIYMFNRIAFAGSYSKFFTVNIIDVNKREFYILLTLVLFTVILGIYPAPIMDGLHYYVTSLIYASSLSLCILPGLYPTRAKVKTAIPTGKRKAGSGSVNFTVAMSLSGYYVYIATWLVIYYMVYMTQNPHVVESQIRPDVELFIQAMESTVETMEQLRERLDLSQQLSPEQVNTALLTINTDSLDSLYNTGHIINIIPQAGEPVFEEYLRVWSNIRDLLSGDLDQLRALGRATWLINSLQAILLELSDYWPPQ